MKIQNKTLTLSFFSLPLVTNISSYQPQCTISPMQLKSSAMVVGPTNDATKQTRLNLRKTCLQHLHGPEPNTHKQPAYGIIKTSNRSLKHPTTSVRFEKSSVCVLPGCRIFLLRVQSAARNWSPCADWTEDTKG